jgi:hypothetical protein
MSGDFGTHSADSMDYLMWRIHCRPLATGEFAQGILLYWLDQRVVHHGQ